MGGLLGKAPEVNGVKMAGGPQMFQLSLDGRRLYVTTSLFSTWDNQFYPEIRERGGVMIQIDCDPVNGGMSINEDFIVVEQGCAIVADGTAEQPIIFTALAEVNGTVEDGDRGLWGGLVINGRAPINDCPEGATGGTVECTKEGEIFLPEWPHLPYPSAALSLCQGPPVGWRPRPP